MGEKSRGNWPVSWCSKAKECAGNCDKCIRKSGYVKKKVDRKHNSK